MGKRAGGEIAPLCIASAPMVVHSCALEYGGRYRIARETSDGRRILLERSALSPALRGASFRWAPVLVGIFLRMARPAAACVKSRAHSWR